MPPARGGGGKGGKYTIVNVGAPSKRSAKEEAKEKELEEMSGYVEETDLSKSPMNLSGQPTKVYLNILLMRINNIDTVSASADIKIKFNLRWIDPRMVGKTPKEVPSELWGPWIILQQATSDCSCQEERPMSIINSETGQMLRTVIFEGPVQSFMDLAKFPVDADDLELSFVVVKSMSKDNEISHYQKLDHVDLLDVRKHPDPAFYAMFAKENFFNLAGWRKEMLNEWDLKTFHFSFKPWLAPSGVEYAKIFISFKLYRKTGFYLWKIMGPLICLFFLSAMVFSFDIDEYEARLNFAATMFLAAMAFLYVIGSELPKVSYLTSMDYLIMFELMSQMAAMVETFLMKQCLAHYVPKEGGEYIDDSEEYVLLSFIDTIASCVVIFVYLLLTLIVLCRSFAQRRSEMGTGNTLEKEEHYEADTHYFIT